VVIAYTAQYIPFAMRILVSDLHRIDGELEESALLTSSSRWAVLRRITLPLCAQGLLTSLFISFVLCLGDLSATLLTIPPGHETLPIKIYNLMHYGAEHMVAALCLFQVFLVLALGLGFYLVYRRMGGM
jgi:iron(III) transport system permease protein